MCKAQSSGVDGRCDGDEMSIRDQRVGTSHSDSVKEDVSLEYITVSPLLALFDMHIACQAPEARQPTWVATCGSRPSQTTLVVSNGAAPSNLSL
jgi:hypothetical protein